MEDKRHENYVPPKPTARPFGGKGQMLGRLDILIHLYIRTVFIFI